MKRCNSDGTTVHLFAPDAPLHDAAAAAIVCRRLGRRSEQLVAQVPSSKLAAVPDWHIMLRRFTANFFA